MSSASSSSYSSMANNNNTNSKSKNADQVPQIRHAGRAHIRGKIRRVWRPRYLELFDRGLVRYYELPHTADVGLAALSDLDHVNMIPKYTLQVHHARILDVTTLRDMHTGLPRGSFGFLFRGQRLVSASNNCSQSGPSSSSSSISATTAATAANTTAADVSSSADTATTQQCRPGAEPAPEQRDFLCAVSSLEEAQMWVVALQWAATQHYTPQQGKTFSTATSNTTAAALATGASTGVSAFTSSLTEPWWNTDTAWPDDDHMGGNEDDDDFDVYSLGSGSIVSVTSKGRNAMVGINKVVPSPQHGSSVQFRKEKKAVGKMIVTKVTQFRTVRLSSWQWEIAYEIQGLLVRGQHVETWKLLRTADDFSTLIANLCKELGPALLDRAQMGPIRQLPRLQETNNRPTQSQLLSSLSVVDSILRSLVMDAAMINCLAMKDFLGLAQKPAAEPLSVRWWQWHEPTAVWERRTRTLPSHVTADQYVKQWMQQTAVSKQSVMEVYAATALQRPLLLLGGLGLSTVALVPLTVLWNQYMPVLSIRLDYLIGSWVSVAYLGRWMPAGETTSGLEPRSSSNNNKLARGQHRSSATPSTKRRDETTLATVRRRVGSHESEVIVMDGDEMVSNTSGDDGTESDGEDAIPEEEDQGLNDLLLSSPLPEYSSSDGFSCWSQPPANIFRVRGANYLKDKIKIQSDACPLICRGVDVWMTDNPQRHIARHPNVLGGKLGDEDTFMINFLLPFGNFVAYFAIPPLNKFPKKLRNVWTKFLKGDQQYRDARLKLLPVVMDGPWIVKAAVGPGTAPALLGKVIPLQYFFRDPDRTRKGVYEVDVIITASKIAKGILSVVKGHTKSLTIAFAIIIEAAEQEELPETVLCSFQAHSLVLEDCPLLPDCNLDDIS